MDHTFTQLSQQARQLAQRKDWTSVAALAQRIKNAYKNEAEGYFLDGLAQKGLARFKLAIGGFNRALNIEPKRYDAGIELAQLYLMLLKHADAFKLLNEYEHYLSNSPLYLDMAAGVFTGLGLHDRAWPLYKKAYDLQPEIDTFKANLAACAVLLGKVAEAKALYTALLSKYPQHQKNHYELSKLETAKNDSHIKQMESLLAATKASPEQPIYLYYALGKELEDLARWEESFAYYQKAGAAVLSVANYKVEDDLRLIDKIIDTCNADWIANTPSSTDSETKNKKRAETPTPIFVVGLPRTGTTLVERILSSHSKIESADETFFMQMAIRDASGSLGIHEIDEITLEKAAKKDIQRIAEHYMRSVAHRLTGKPMFVDKYPFNYLYLGFIAKAFPDAKIVYLKREPMDACFALFKQSFFKFAYSLNDLGKYYVAQDKLRQHWHSVLGERLIEVSYESFVRDQEKSTKQLLQSVGVEFESACLRFEQNPNASATASTLQVREKIHARSVNKWQHFEKQLRPLREYLAKYGIMPLD